MVNSRLSGYPAPMKMTQATVSIEDVPDGANVTIEYEDGHVVRLSVKDGDSFILRRHLDALDSDDVKVTREASSKG